MIQFLRETFSAQIRVCVPIRGRSAVSVKATVNHPTGRCMSSGRTGGLTNQAVSHLFSCHRRFTKALTSFPAFRTISSSFSLPLGMRMLSMVTPHSANVGRHDTSEGRCSADVFEPVKPQRPSCCIRASIELGTRAGWKIGTRDQTSVCSISGGTKDGRK